MNFYANHKIAGPGKVTKRAETRGRGFTLIEILVAIAVFALLITALFSAFNHLFAGMGTVEEASSTYLQARLCFDRIITDLRSIYVLQPPAYRPPDFDDEPDPYRFLCEHQYGEKGRLQFAAFSHLSLGSRLPANVGRIVYYMETTFQGETVLKRADDILRIGSEKNGTESDPVVCEKVKTFTIQCFDDRGEAHEVWDSDDREFGHASPRAVKVILEVAGEGPGRSYTFQTVVDLPVYREKIHETGI